MKKFDKDTNYAWSKYKAINAIVWIIVTAVALLGYPIALVIALSYIKVFFNFNN